MYKTIILPVVLYECETWSLTIREANRLSVFENRVLRRIFETKRNEVKGGWRKLHNEELHDLYSSSSIITINKSWRMRRTGHVVRMGKDERMRKLERRRPLLGPSRRFLDNIKMDLVEIGLGSVDCVVLTRDRDK
jgi:hypothetical protein